MFQRVSVRESNVCASPRPRRCQTFVHTGAPYHHRLDWNIWFIGFKPHRQMLEGRERWLYAFLAQLLRDGDAPARRLLDPASRAVWKSNRALCYRRRRAPEI